MKHSMTFSEANEYIRSLESRGWDLGLDRMEEFVYRCGLMAYVGVGPVSPRFIHVAGTNGKGSVTAYVKSILHEQGYQTGGYFSPYVFDIRERIQSGFGLISEELFASLASQIRPHAEAMESGAHGGPTEFEFKTMMAFAYFRHLKAEWVALEVGLGGRLDATNVVSPACSVITSIGWDHMAILGDTQEKIAAEKAGIIKRGVPVVVGPMADGPREVIESIARDAGAPIYRFGREFQLEYGANGYVVRYPDGEVSGLRPGMRGHMQPENMSIAVMSVIAGGAMRSPEMMRDGVARAFIPARFQQFTYCGVPVIVDGAHNSDAAQNLRESLDAIGVKKVVLVTNMLEGHDLESFYSSIKDLVTDAIVVPIEFFRARKPADTAETLRGMGIRATAYSDLAEGISFATDLASKSDVTLLVTGSFYVAGDVGSFMGAPSTLDHELTVG